MKLKNCILSPLLTAGLVAPAFADPVLTDLTTADYITVGNLDWAWAAPITSGVWFGQNTLYQAGLHVGWREATDLEWASRPIDADFGGKCASKYWNSNFTHCDFGDTLSQHWIAAPENTADLWYVRDTPVDPAQVPEPDSLALAAVALLALLVARKKNAR
jgi:hypothetical protein